MQEGDRRRSPHVVGQASARNNSDDCIRPRCGIVTGQRHGGTVAAHTLRDAINIRDYDRQTAGHRFNQNADESAAMTGMQEAIHGSENVDYIIAVARKSHILLKSQTADDSLQVFEIMIAFL